MRAQSYLSTALLSTLVLGVTFSGEAAPGLRFLEPRGGDLIPSRLVASEAPSPVPPAGRELVTFSWALDASATLSPPLGPLTARSREHWVQATGAELERGVLLYALAPGAVVRLSPATPGTAMPPVTSLAIATAEGETHGGNLAFETLASADQLAAAGMELPSRSLAFRLRSELGGSGLSLRVAPGAVPATDRFLVHVLDAGSTVELKLTSLRAVYLDGQPMIATFEALDSGARLPLAEVTAFLTSPAGRAWPVKLTPGSKGGLRAELKLDGREAWTAGLWELHAAALGEANGQPFRRNARVAFAVSLPTARLSGTAEATALEVGRGLEVRLGVEVASAGRYEARGLLFGTDSTGAMKPAAAAHSATWLEPGAGTVALSFDAKALLGAGLEAPFEIRQLELRDQGRMSLLEHRARGLVIE